MRVSAKKLCTLVIALFMLASNLTFVMSRDDYLSQTFKGSNFHEITRSDADRLFESGEKFILLYFSYNCGITLSRIAMFQQLMDEYNIKIYGLNGLNEKVPNWILDKFKFDNGQVKSIRYPVVCTVVNKKDYACLDGSYSLREQTKQISDYLLKTKGKQVKDSLWKGFYELNAAVKARQRADKETLNHYLKPTGLIQSNDGEIKKLSDNITKGLQDDYSKLKAIHAWVAGNIIYDMYTLRSRNEDYYLVKGKDYSALGTLKSKVSVCVGYANLTAALARNAGIPCKVVTGFADGYNSFNSFQDIFKRYKEYQKTGDEKVFSGMISNHAWNEAFVKGRWVILDTTWDSNNEDHGGKTTMAKPGGKYFDIGLEEFSETHAFWKSEFFDQSLNNTVKPVVKEPEVKASGSVTAVPVTSTILIQGEKLFVDAYTIGGNNYFKLRDLAFMLHRSNSNKQFEVQWDSKTSAIHILTSKKYTPGTSELQANGVAGPQKAVLNTSPVYLDGKRIYLSVYTINGNNYFKLRDIASCIDFKVDYDAASKTTIIDPLLGYSEKASSNQNNPNQVVKFTDPAFEKAIRLVLAKPQGDLFSEDLSKIWEIIINGKGVLGYRTKEMYDNNVFYKEVKYGTETNKIENLSDLGLFVNLRSLYVSGHPFKNINVISKLIHLQSLSIGGVPLKDLSFISGLTNLHSLFLEGNEIADISLVSNLKKLENLSLNFNKIRDIRSISGLMNLKCLYLEHNQISDISAVAGLTNLERLLLGNNLISDIQAIHNLRNLEFLTLDQNQIKDINAVSKLTKLKHLSLDNNKVSMIDAVSGLSSLITLSSRNNPITSYEPALKLPNLQLLNGAPPSKTMADTEVVSEQDNPIFPVDLTLGPWFGLTYPTHQYVGDVLHAHQYSAIDLNLPKDADKGKDVYAIQGGKVIHSSEWDGCVIIEHTVPLVLKNGTVIKKWYSLYGHMKNIIPNKKTVSKGDIIGQISNKSANNNHLHFSMYRKKGSIEDAISPYWLPGDYSKSKSLYADDQYGTRKEGTEKGLYDNRIFSTPPLK